MSVSNLLNPNEYDLYCDNITVSQSVSVPIMVGESEVRSKYTPAASSFRGFTLVAGDNAADTRWNLYAEGLEAGNNAGSDLKLSNYNDSGALVSDVITITRADGKVELNGDLELAANHQFILPVNQDANNLGKAGSAGIANGGSTATISNVNIGTKPVILVCGAPVGNSSPCTGNLYVSAIDDANNTFTVTSTAANNGDSDKTFNWVVLNHTVP